MLVETSSTSAQSEDYNATFGNRKQKRIMETDTGYAIPQRRSGQSVALH